jgi:membrane-bound metal-dependent hydrolase YbcI (DUF457 family)
MKEKTHYLVGAASSLLICTAMHLSLDTSITITVGAIMGSDLPDIDQYSKNFQHRKQTHSLWFPLVIFVLNYTIFKNISLYGVCIGVIMHILMDLLNGKGCWLLYPYKMIISVADIKYNGRIEDYIRILSGLIIIIIIFNQQFKFLSL